MFSIAISPALATEMAREQMLRTLDESRRLRRSRLVAEPDVGTPRHGKPARRRRVAWTFGLQGRAAH